MRCRHFFVKKTLIHSGQFQGGLRWSLNMRALPASTLESIVAEIDYSTAWSAWEPPMKMHDDGEMLTVVFEMPEVPPHTLSMVVTSHSFTIFGYRPVQPGTLSNGNAVYNGRFRRRVPLPEDVRVAENDVKVWRGLVIIRFPR